MSKLLNSIEQGTPEWHQYRSEGINASEAGVILGVSPYQTPLQLWRQRLGLDPATPNNPAMQRGHDLEPLAREEFTRMTGIEVEPALQIHPELTYMRCSLDGLSLDGKTIVEIKCGGKNLHQQAINGIVPDHYYAQVQHQIKVCELDKAFYFSYNGHEGILIEIKRDEPYIQRLIVEEKKFWDCIQNLVKPELNENDYIKRDDYEWQKAAMNWKRANLQRISFEMIEKQERQNLIALASQSNSWGADIKLSKCTRKGNVDYKKIINDYNIVDEEKYRKPDSEYFIITEV